MRCAQFVGFFGVESGMYATKDHPDSTLACNPPKFQAAKCIGGVDANTNDIAGLEPIRIKALQGFVAD
jgi:hypothetical protein